MNKRLTPTFIGLVTAIGALTGEAYSQERSTDMPAPRHPDVAVQEQYDDAVAKGKKSAYTLFIQRYPKHRLAHKMRKLMRKKGMKTP